MSEKTNMSAAGKERFPIVQFAGQNFSTWAFRMKSILREAGVLEVIEKEDNKDDAFEAKAQAIIIAAVADSHLEYVKKKTAYEMFSNLQENFQKKGVRSKLYLRRQLAEIKYSEVNPLIEHLNRMEQIFTELEEAESNLSEEERVNYILLSMPKTYEGIITALETVKDLKLDFVKNRLLGEEEKRRSREPVTGQQHMGAFSCFICGKPGHKKFQCHQRGYRNGYGRSSSQGAGHSQGQGWNQEQGRGWSQGRGQGWSQGRGQRWSQARGRQAYSAESEVNDVAFMCNENTSDVRESESVIEWCVDSGCSDHLVNNKDYFTDYIELKEAKVIAAAKNYVSLQAGL